MITPIDCESPPFQNNSHQNSIDELFVKEEKLKERDEMVSCLLEELVKVRQSSAECEDTIRNLKTKIQELEEVSYSVQIQ